MPTIRVRVRIPGVDHRAKRLDRVYVAYTDPGHGWLAVPMRTMEMLGIADKVSTCSYISRSGMTAYLEEDADTLLFVERLEREGVEFRHRLIHCESTSSIRRLPHYPTQKRS